MFNRIRFNRARYNGPWLVLASVPVVIIPPDPGWSTGTRRGPDHTRSGGTRRGPDPGWSTGTRR